MMAWEALEKWKAFDPDLVILDLMLPELDGFKVLEEIRLDDDRLPILILSAKDTVEDKVRCLKKGVDDYMSKPFDLDEFLLRIDRILQRAQWSAKNDPKEPELKKVEFGVNWVDFTKRAGHGVNGQVVLTIQELKLLKVLINHEGESLSRQYLLENAFGYSFDANSRTVDNFIVRFRKYFEVDPKNPAHFISKRSVGYVFHK